MKALSPSLVWSASVCLISCLLFGCPKEGQVKKTNSATSQKTGTKTKKAKKKPGKLLATGKPATDFSLQDLDENDVTLKKYRGRVVLINFWATWCGPCKKELVYFNKFYKKYKKKGFVLLAISTDDGSTVSQVGPTIRKYGYNFPVLLDTEGEVVNIYNPKRATPFSALIDRKGNVRFEHPGFNPGDEQVMEKYIQVLLKEK